MKQKKMQQGYISPETQLLGIMPMSILCQSGEEGTGFSTSLEDMTENDYTFGF